MFFYGSGNKHEPYSGLKSWLRQHGHDKFASSGNNLMICCPFHNERNPSMGIILDQEGNGIYQCWGCGQKGNIEKLIKHYDGYTQDTLNVKKLMSIGSPISALEYKNRGSNVFKQNFEVYADSIMNQYKYKTSFWKSRGINDESVKKFLLGFDPVTYFAGVTPVRHYENLQILGVNFRIWYEHPDCPIQLKNKIDNKIIKKYIYQKDTKRNLSFGCIETVQGCSSMDTIWLFEGFIDAVNFWQRTGEPTLARWGSDLAFSQVDYLKRFKQVNIVMDNDVAGEISARKTYLKLIENKVRPKLYKIDLPVKDYSEAVTLGHDPIPLITV